MLQIEFNGLSLGSLENDSEGSVDSGGGLAQETSKKKDCREMGQGQSCDTLARIWLYFAKILNSE